jgi:hypothetical protein
MMVPALPPLVQIEDSTDFSRASVNAIWELASVRIPVPSIGVGSAGEPAVPFDDCSRSRTGSRRSCAALRCCRQPWLGWCRPGCFDIALQFETLEHFLIGQLIVAPG